MDFWLGVHRPHWLATAGVPLFVSAVTLRDRRTYPRALAPWALDSGGFTELHRHGRWTVTADAYAREINHWASEIGGLAWAAPQDWMCEPFMLAKTGLTVRQHQDRTAWNYLDLRALDAPVIPVLQGWTISDYLHCVDLYQAHGVDLARVPLVGLGSVCRRQNTTEAALIVRRLSDEGIRLHGFGFKITGLEQCGDALASADSMAWSMAGRYDRLPGCTHKSCANCLRYALRWRTRLLERTNQLSLLEVS